MPQIFAMRSVPSMVRRSSPTRISESAQSGLTGLSSGKILKMHQLLGLLFDVFAHLFGQIVIKMPTTEDSSLPAHRVDSLRILDASRGTEHHLDAFEHPVEARDLMLQVT